MYIFRKQLLNRKVLIITSSSFPEHSTLGDVKSSIRVRVGFSFGFFFTFRLLIIYGLYGFTQPPRPGQPSTLEMEDRVRKPNSRYLQIYLQTIVMCRGRSNQENTRVAANFVHVF